MDEGTRIVSKYFSRIWEMGKNGAKWGEWDVDELLSELNKGEEFIEPGIYDLMEESGRKVKIEIKERMPLYTKDPL